MLRPSFRRFVRLASCALLLAAAACGRGVGPGAPVGDGSAPGPDPGTASWLVAGARLVDGSGAPARTADVRVAGGVVVEVGELEPRPGETVIDAAGRVLAPGFIDTHSHADDDLAEKPEALAAVSQGITTVVVGQDGESHTPLADYFAELAAAPVAVNVASYSGHGTLRREAMAGDDRRPATDAEIARMAELLRADLDAGAVGLSSGLEYDPGIYAVPGELVTLAREVAARGGRYTSHLRNEDRDFWPALEELLDVGREARLPVHVSHLKLGLRSDWGQADRLIARLDEARAEGIEVTADVYPYTRWRSSLSVFFPDRDFTNRETASFALRELTTPDGLLIADLEADPSVAGKTLAEIARDRGSDPVSVLLELAAASAKQARETGEEDVGVIAEGMSEDDVVRLMLWPQANVCTDGGLDDPHPRGAGSFTRVLGRYVRERGLLSLEEAIHKMTGLAAASMGLDDRGLVRPGMAADLVLLDPATVLDRATMASPHALSVGIVTVWVRGEAVWDDGRATGRRPGQVLRRSTVNRRAGPS